MLVYVNLQAKKSGKNWKSARARPVGALSSMVDTENERELAAKLRIEERGLEAAGLN